MKWWVWRKLVGRLAVRHGFLDPFVILTRLGQFAQPSEVAIPIELLRAGVMFHARGLINSRVIQNNLDWVWPYWVCRQFDPLDPAFMPRAFSMTYVNLTHRNWVAIGIPNLIELPVVDPRGLVTPFLDSWSLDGWVMDRHGELLAPSMLTEATQYVRLEDGFTVVTEASLGSQHLRSVASVTMVNGEPCCRVIYEATGEVGSSLIIALRPYNPEGISLITKLALTSDHKTWEINDSNQRVIFGTPVERHFASNYRLGDAGSMLGGAISDSRQVECEAGMATAVACFDLDQDRARSVTVLIPLAEKESYHFFRREPDKPHEQSWEEILAGHCRLDIPDAQIMSLYEIALRSLILLCPDEVFPGPFTYRRFWFRDACFMIHALLCAGFTDRARHALDHFPERQSLTGFFHSQDGEWDSNGQCLWIMQRYCEITGQPPPQEWKRAIFRGARWLIDMRVDEPGKPHDGLLPAGFSAEHFGPNDYYYWDDFWAIAGLEAAAKMVNDYGDAAFSEELLAQAIDFRNSLMRCLDEQAAANGRMAMPASPYRRLDASAIGCLIAGYPTRILPPKDERLLDTAELLLGRYCRFDGFFHDIIHSGINAYLTLHIAQTLLRAGDSRYRYLLKSVATLASDTGQWPEAIHPHTRGGCMGDGQHGWATAEWILLIRDCFVTEEEDGLILGAGIGSDWLEVRRPTRFGPAPTRFGPVSIEVVRDGGYTNVSWQADFRKPPKHIDIRLPEHAQLRVNPDCRNVSVTRSLRSCV